MTVYYSKGGANDTSYLRFETPANWNTQADGGGSDASSTTDLNNAHLVIQNGDYMDIGANVSCLSLTTESGSHFKGHSSYAITVTGKATASEPSGGGSQDYSINFDGELDNDNQANFTVSTDSANNIDLLPQTTNYARNLTINHASCVSTIQAQLVVKDKINIINGELNTEGHLVNSEEANLEVSTNASAKLTFGTNNVLCGRLGESNGSVGRITQTQSAGSAGIIKARKSGNLRIIDLGTQAIFTGDVILEYQGNQSSGAGSQDLRASSGTFDLIVNCTNTTDTLLCNASPNGLNDVTITKGIFDPNSSALTVAGKMTVGPDSGSDQAKFNAGASDCSIGSGKTDEAALHVRQGGEADLGTGDHTIGSLSVDNNANAKFTNTEGTLTINGHTNDGTRSIIVGGGSTCTAVTSGTRVTDLTYGSDALLTISNTNAIYNLTITGNATYRLKNHMFIGNDLTVTSGSSFKCQTSGSSGTHRNFTLGGDLLITGGTVDCEDAATITVGGGIKLDTGTLDGTSGSTIVSGVLSTGFIGMAVNNGGSSTFNHNNGTFQFDNSGETWISSNVTGTDITFKNLTINGNIYMNKTDIIVDNHLLINAGKKLRQYNSYNELTVNGLCLVNGILGTAGKTGDFQFATLEIGSGATFEAPDANTTITTGGTVNGISDTAFGGQGTFNANNGTLILDSVKHRIPKGGTFNNVKMIGSQNTGGVYLYSDTLLPQATMPDGTTHDNYFAVLGTLEITDDEFRPYNADKVYIHNLVIGDGTGSANSAKFDFSEADSFDGKVFVDNVTIHSDGQLLFGDGDETSTTEGSSALNISGSFRNLGGSVDIA